MFEARGMDPVTWLKNYCPWLLDYCPCHWGDFGQHNWELCPNMEPSPGAALRPDEQTTAGVPVNHPQMPPDSPHYDQDRIEQWRALVSLHCTDRQARIPPDPEKEDQDGEDWEMVDV
ncbi:hypothetical protein CPLU01_15494 [Colletotrichum plurivorum]|uniref:Uncharacterized protein n=1 Tax=Colletotrichum plurivorum TaxID=2175906 RepID=A0A8H6MUJ2_9PEZI|nr:hypothetical protein CPLU01_15494 [Colletotrichum plurivorum]